MHAKLITYYLASAKNMGCYSLPPLQESRPEIQSVEREKEGFAPVFNYLLEECGLQHHNFEMFIQRLER